MASSGMGKSEGQRITCTRTCRPGAREGVVTTPATLVMKEILGLGQDLSPLLLHTGSSWLHSIPHNAAQWGSACASPGCILSRDHQNN